ncbi:ergothioneine biosynthesis protein EgtB, partial [Acinetobacter baumannii]
YDERWPFLFNSYYNAEGDRHARPNRGLITRPSLNDVIAYRAAVDAALVAAMPTLPPAALTLVELGCHHEQQHQELLLT